MTLQADSEAALQDSVCLAFERAARAAAERPALFHDGAALSYEELRRRQQRVVRALAAAGWPRSVALVHDRTPGAVAAILAVLDSGATLIPIDAAQPDARVEVVLDDARPALVLVEEPERLAFRGARPLAAFVSEDPSASAPPARESDRPALVLYTSGSTGVPKPVAWSLGDFTRAVVASTSNLPLTGDEVWLCKANGGLVDQMDELFGALLRGRPTVLASRDDVAQPRRLVALMARHGVTRFTLVPSYLRVLLQTVPDLAVALPRLRTWVATGEPIDRALVRTFHERVPHGVLYNDYGTTEAWGLTIARLDAGSADAGPIPLGDPYPGVTLALVDDDGAAVPAGVIGWLAVGSPWFSDGARAALERGLSRTGDLARRHPDGAIELVGRGDGQLKIHGLRIDPVEIEGLLATHPDLLEAAVTSWRGAGGRDHLIAHVVPRPGLSMPDERELERHLRGRLPPAWLPARYQTIAALPRNAGGKLDRRRLPPPSVEPEAASGGRAATPFELEVADLLAHALGGAPLQVDDDLRRRGLDSLGVITAVTALHDRFGIELAGRELMATRTAREISALIEHRQPRANSVEEVASAPDPAGEPVTAAMATAIGADWAAGGLDPAWNIVDRFELHGALELERLRLALRALVLRHDALRARFVRRGDGYVHFVDQDVEPELRLHPPAAGLAEIAKLTELEKRVAAIAAERASERFRWEEVPRVRFDLVPHSARRATLIVTIDHLVSDEESLWILGRDLLELYRALELREVPRLPPVPPLRAIARQVVDTDLRLAGEERLRRICAAARGTSLVSEERKAALSEAGPLRALTSELGPTRVAALSRRGTELGTTTHALLLTAAVAVRWFEERLPLVPVSTVLSGRDDLRYADSVGLFNRLALLLLEEVGEESTLLGLVGEVDRELRCGWRYQDVDTFGAVLREGCVPLIRACRVNFYVRDLELAPDGDLPLRAERRELFEPQTMDEWSMQITASDRFVLRLEGRDVLISEERAAWGLGAYLAVLDALVTDLDSTLGGLLELIGAPPARGPG